MMASGGKSLFVYTDGVERGKVDRPKGNMDAYTIIAKAANIDLLLTC